MKMNWNASLQDAVLVIEERSLEVRKPTFHQAIRKDAPADNQEVDESPELGWFLKLPH
jgi:methionine-rich copper-binding protein CopC